MQIICTSIDNTSVDNTSLDNTSVDITSVDITSVDITSVDKFLQPVSSNDVHKHSSQGKLQCVTIHKHDFLNCLFSVLFLLFNCTITNCRDLVGTVTHSFNPISNIFPNN